MAENLGRQNRHDPYCLGLPHQVRPHAINLTVLLSHRRQAPFSQVQHGFRHRGIHLAYPGILSETAIRQQDVGVAAACMQAIDTVPRPAKI